MVGAELDSDVDVERGVVGVLLLVVTDGSKVKVVFVVVVVEEQEAGVERRLLFVSLLVCFPLSLSIFFLKVRRPTTFVFLL